MHALQLYSYQACPFARRARMTLLEKGLEYTLTEIDIRNKPANFNTISPYGKVPVLIHAGRRIYESAIINEYLDECFPEPPLLPPDPYTRAQARIWMDYCGSRFATASWNHAQAGDDPAKQNQALSELQRCFEFMEQAGLRELGEGPFWIGNQISLVDIQYIPFFQRFLDRALVDVPASCTRLRGWLELMRERPSFISTAPAH